MKTALSGEQIADRRFPQLTFLLHLLEGEPWLFCEQGRNGSRSGEFLHRPHRIGEEVSFIFSKLQLKNIEVLYLYGIGLGHYGMHVLDWLKEDQKRDLIFLEEDIEVLRLFFRSEQAHLLLSHPQIHFRFLFDPMRWKDFLEERAAEFPYEHVEFLALESYHKKNPRQIAKMKLHLMRRTTVHHAIHMEESFHHVLSKNVFSNFSRISSAFYANRFQNAFKEVPAIICGAGPSLGQEVETLRALEHRTLVFAGGSAIAALSHAGVLPHLGVAIDPNFEEYYRFKNSLAFAIPLLYTNRLHPSVFETCSGPCGYIRALTGGPVEAWWEKEVGIEPLTLQGEFDLEALSVTTTCLELALTMGCNPIVLVGVDLAFTDEKTYAAGIINQSRLFLSERHLEVRASERLLKRRDRKGKPIYTLVKWIMESQAISRFAKKHKHVTVLNSTSGGIGFRGIPYHPLSELSFLRRFDMRGRLHQLIESHRISLDSSKVIDRLRQSLSAAKTLIAQALAELKRIAGEAGNPESGRMFFYQMELKELIFYKCCLEQPALTLQKTFNRLNRPSSWDITSEERDALKWRWLYAKWNAFHDLTTYIENSGLQNKTNSIL